MAYENIDVNKLNSALEKLDNINSDSLANLKNNLTSDQWESTVRTRITTAMTTLLKEYDTLTEDIENSKNIKVKIKKYQDIKEEYDSLAKDKNNYWSKYEQYKKMYNNAESNKKNIYLNKKNFYYNKYLKAKSEYNSKKSALESAKRELDRIC